MSRLIDYWSIDDHCSIQSVKCTFETLEKENAMHVWVEPEHWEGEGPAPIKQLAVTVKHFVNGVASSAQNAIDNTETTCQFIPSAIIYPN